MNVIAVHSSPQHNFSKLNRGKVNLIAGIGIEGDAHGGEHVKHVYQMLKSPKKKNIRQVHLIGQELLDEMSDLGFDLLPGDIGENITTQGIDLINLPLNSVLKFPSGAEVQLTGLRTPCNQLNKFKPGLMKALFYIDNNGKKQPKVGVMSIVIQGGIVEQGDAISIILPEHQKEMVPI